MEKTEELLFALQNASRKLRDFKENEIENLDIEDFPFSYFRYLEAIDELVEPNFIELAQFLGLSKPTITVMVNKMIQKGFIQKSRSALDKRNYKLNLTEKGKGIIEGYGRSQQKFVEDIASRFNDEELDVFIALLLRV